MPCTDTGLSAFVAKIETLHPRPVNLSPHPRPKLLQNSIESLGGFMRPVLRDAFKLSQGERARALAFLIVGVSSATLGLLAVLHLDKGVLFNGLSRAQAWIVCAATIGGLLALFLSGERLGQPGRKGAAQAVAGGIWITFAGALIGGTLSLPFYGTMFGPFIVTVTFAGAPVLAILWICNLTSTHILLCKYHTERDSIFTVCYRAPSEATDKAGAQARRVATPFTDNAARPAPYRAQPAFRSESGGLILFGPRPKRPAPAVLPAICRRHSYQGEAP